MPIYFIFTLLNIITLFVFAMASQNFCSVDGCLWALFVIVPAFIGWISVVVFLIKTLKNSKVLLKKSDSEFYIRLFTAIFLLIAYAIVFHFAD